MPRLHRLLSLVVVLAACAEPVELPAVPVERDRTPVIASLSREQAWGGETIELRGANLGEPGERVRVVFAGGAEAGADQRGLGESLAVVVPPESRDGPVRVIVEHGQAESPQELKVLGPDRLTLGAVTGTLDLSLGITRVFEVGTEGAVAIVHSEGGLLRHTDTTTSDYPRAHVVLPGDRPVSLEMRPDTCASAAVIVRAPDLETEEAEVCLGAEAGDASAIELSASRDGRWLAVVARSTLLWTIDLAAETPVATRITAAPTDLVLGSAWMEGSRFAIGARTRAFVLDAATGTFTEALRALLSEARLIGMAASGPVIAVGQSSGEVRLYDARTLPAVLLRTVRPAVPISPRDRTLFLSSNGRYLALTALDQGTYFWDLDREADTPVARLSSGSAFFGLQESRDGRSFLAAARGHFSVIDADSLREIASVPVIARIGATRLVTWNGGLTLLAARIDARDVVFIEGADYAATSVQVPDDLVSMAPEPDAPVVWVLGARGLWRVTREGARFWLLAPDGGYAAQLLYVPERRHLVAAWQFANGTDVEWIDPAQPPGRRSLGWRTLSGLFLDSVYLFGTRLVGLSLKFGNGEPDALMVDVFEGANVDAETPPVRVDSLRLDPILASLPIGGRLLAYEPVADGVPMVGLWVDPVTVTLESVGPVPFIGLEVAASPSHRFLVWREGGGLRLQNRLVSVNIDPRTLARTYQGPLVAIEDGFVPAAVLPRGDAVVLVDRSGDRLQLVR